MQSIYILSHVSFSLVCPDQVIALYTVAMYFVPRQHIQWLLIVFALP